MSALVFGLLGSEGEQGDVVISSKVPDLGDELAGELAQERGRSDGIAAVLGEKVHQASAVLEVGYVAVEIEPVQGLELESDVALEKIADVRWSIHATRVRKRWQWAIPVRALIQAPAQSDLCVHNVVLSPSLLWSV